VPEFITHSSSPTSEAEKDITVERITELDEFETVLSVAGASLVPGNRVTLATGAMQVTATTTSGVFKLNTPGGPAGTRVRGMFRR
jgi:hypothetical protein